MATGMVLVIVTRNIDLSVGSVLGFVGMIMGVMQAEILPHIGFIGFDNPFTWLIVIAVGIAVGAAIGAFQGFIIAYLGVPAFIVTLGGLLVWRGAAWWVTSGRTVAPMDPIFRLLVGGPAGSVGEFVELDHRPCGMRRDHLHDHQFETPASAVPVSAATGLGRDTS